jgi:hypothetical protein
MLHNSWARICSRARTSVCRHRAIRPLPSRNGWIMTRFRWAIAARTIAAESVSAASAATSSSTRPGTSSASGASYAISPVASLRTQIGPRRQRPGLASRVYSVIMKCRLRISAGAYANCGSSASWIT